MLRGYVRNVLGGMDMDKKTKKNTVTRKASTRGTKSITSSNKKQKKQVNLFKKIYDFAMQHKIICGIFLVVILIIIFTLLFLRISLNFTVLTINEDKYSKADMNMSLYNSKYSYFGKDASEISDATLDEKITSLNMTVSEYLKEEAVLELKYRSAINEIAKENNISLTKKDIKDIDSDMKNVIKSFNGHSKFRSFLRKNKINERAYRSYLESNKLYEKVYKKLYSKGKKNYLTKDEIEKYTSSYKEDYYKVNQIVLAIVDNDTLESLSDTEVNQKKVLIETIQKEIESGADFLELVDKYSEEASDDNNLYFTKDDVLEEIYNAVKDLEDNEVSDIIKTKYAYSIIKRLPLDDKKLSKYLVEKAKAKLNDNITERVEDYKVFYENAYKNIK